MASSSTSTDRNHLLEGKGLTDDQFIELEVARNVNAFKEREKQVGRN